MKFVNIKALRACAWAEVLKLRRSKIVWITFGILMVFAVFLSFPRMGLMRGDADRESLFGPGDIASYFKTAMMMMYAIGSWVFGFIAAWTFGREFTDRTAMDLLAMPFPRSTIVFAKTIVLICIILIFSVCQFAFYCVMGIVVPVSGGWSWEFVAGIFGRYLVTTIMIAALSTPIIFLASCTRGYLAAVAVLVVVLMLTNFAGLLGVAAYYPWSIVRTFAEDGTALPVSVAIVRFTCFAGLAAATAWWRYADQNK